MSLVTVEQITDCGRGMVLLLPVEPICLISSQFKSSAYGLHSSITITNARVGWGWGGVPWGGDKT